MGVRVTETDVRISTPKRFGVVAGQVVVCIALGAAWLVLMENKDSRPPLIAIAVALPIALVIGCSRALLLGMRMDESGVTVRNFWETRKISWPDVSHLGDGHVFLGSKEQLGPGNVWALGVVLRDGRVISVSTIYDISPAEKEEIRQAAARYEVRVQLTGEPGPEYRSLRSLRRPVGPGNLVSRGPGVAAKAARAKVWVVVLAVATAALPVVGLATALWSRIWWDLAVVPCALLPGFFLAAAWSNWREWADLERQQRASRRSEQTDPE
jgi:hypothetical protein